MGNLDIRPVKGNINADELTPGGDAVWLDFNFGIGGLARGASAPDLIALGTTSIETLGFDGINTPEEVSVALELNHNWKEGTNLKPHIHWYPTTAAAGNVNWQMEYVLVHGNVVPASTIINVIVATPGVAWRSVFTNFPEIVTTGFVIGTQFHVRLFRDPTDNDTYGSDVALATFGVHVQIDTLGSRQVAIK